MKTRKYILPILLAVLFGNQVYCSDISGSNSSSELKNKDYQVPGSVSPDGRYAIVVTPTGGDEYRFYIKDLRANNYISMLGETMNSALDESALMYGIIAPRVLRLEPHDPAVDYFVSWNHEGSIFCIEGGEHKFWHCCIYHKGKTGFAKLNFDPEPVDKLNDLTKTPSSEIADMGVHNYGSPLF